MTRLTNPISEHLADHPLAGLIQIPAVIHRLPRLSSYLGCKIHVLRDDLTRSSASVLPGVRPISGSLSVNLQNPRIRFWERRQTRKRSLWTTGLSAVAMP